MMTSRSFEKYRLLFLSLFVVGEKEDFLSHSEFWCHLCSCSKSCWCCSTASRCGAWSPTGSGSWRMRRSTSCRAGPWSGHPGRDKKIFQKSCTLSWCWLTWHGVIFAEQTTFSRLTAYHLKRFEMLWRFLSKLFLSWNERERERERMWRDREK